MIDLKKFCRKSHYAGTLTEPFNEGNYTYASDGSIVIRVDKIPEITKTYPSVKAGQIFEENKINGYEIWIDPPEFKVIERECNYCKGTGKITICKECNGAGGIQFNTIYNVYDVECLSCGGKETVNVNGKCEDCEGTGKYKEYSNPIIETDIIINGNLERIKIMLGGTYLEMIQVLPNIKIALQDSSIKPVKLKFDGGIGLLMPMEMGKS